jgi:hypothetical protein
MMIYSVVSDFEGSGNPAFTFSPITFFADNPSSADAATITILRRSPAGGTPGFTNNALRVIHVTDPDTTSYEWALLSEIQNNSEEGQNCGAYLLGRKNSTGQTWGAVFEVIETSAVNNPTSGSLGCEVDVSANGTDAVFPYARVGVDLAIRKFDAGGPDCHAGWGFRIQNGGYAGSLVRIGFGFYTGMNVVDAFDCSLATVLGAALKMPAGAGISFDDNYQHMLKYDTGGLGYYAAGVLKVRLNASGSIQTQAMTVASLPAAGNPGNRAFVTDATTNTFNSVLAGGGSNKVPVFDDGAAWRVG